MPDPPDPAVAAAAAAAATAAAGVGVVTVRQFEEATQPRNSTLNVMKRALEGAGVEFIEESGGGPGVRLRKPGT